MGRLDVVNWEAVNALLDELLELPPAQRSARLAEVAKESPACAEEVAALLGRQEAIDQEHFLETPPVESTELEELGALAGRRIGDYVLEKQIGVGGMGSVWLARHSGGHYERKSAIKFLNLFQLGDAAVECLRREASALAKLSHPNITHLVDADVSAGQPYLVLEYVEGQRIDTWCDEHGLDVIARVRLFLQVLAAVSHAHSRLILHRDLKPSNILVTEDGMVKLLDFGVARLLEEAGQAQPSGQVTRLIGSALTPEYAAPEQMLAGELTAASDVYSLGVLLYLLLAGTHPVATMNATPARQLRTLLEDQPRRASDAALNADATIADGRGTSLQQLSRALRGDLDNILAKAMKKNPVERYATVAALADDLHRYLDHEPISARADSRVYRLRKFMRRYRGAVAATCITVLALVAGIAGTTWQAIEAKRQRAEATAHALESVRQRDAARFQAQRAEASSEFMSVMLEEVGQGGQPLTPVDLVDRGVQLLDRRYSADPKFAGRMLVQMSRRYMDLGSTDRQSQVLARALTIAQEQNDADLQAAVECTMVRTEIVANRYDSAEQHMQSARSALATARNPEVATRVDCLRAEAEISESKLDMNAAIRHLETAQRLLESSQETRGLQYHAVLTHLGGIYFRTSRFRETLALNERSAEALERNGRGGTLGRVRVAINRASILLRLGELTRAEAATLDAMLRIQRLNEDQPMMPDQLVSYGILLNRLGRADESIEPLTRASSQLRAVGNMLWALSADYHLARAFMLSGKHEEALPLLDKVERLWSENAAANKDRLADLARTRAEIAFARGQLNEARDLIDLSLDRFGHPSAPPSLNLSTALALGARIYSSLDRHSDAETLAQRAVRVSEDIARKPSESADVGEALLALALVLQAQGDRTGAQAHLDRAIESLTNAAGREHPLTRQALELRM